MRYALAVICALIMCGCNLRHAESWAPDVPPTPHQQEVAAVQSGLHWETLAGVGLMAIGAAMMWYLGRYLGGGVVIMGAVVTFASMTVAAIQPYWDEIVWTALGVGALAAIIHFRRYISAVFHMAHKTEALASPGVKALIQKVQNHGTPFLTKLRSLIHHAPLPSATVTTNKPPA